MHPLTCIGILGGAAIMTADRVFHKISDRLAIAVYLVCILLILTGFLLKKYAG